MCHYHILLSKQNPTTTQEAKRKDNNSRLLWPCNLPTTPFRVCVLDCVWLSAKTDLTDSAPNICTPTGLHLQWENFIVEFRQQSMFTKDNQSLIKPP